jgi:pilus assembly protein CpaE
VAVLRSQIRSTGLGIVSVETTDYCRSRTDQSTRRFVDNCPDIIIVDADETGPAVESVQVLHTAMPSAWILVCASAADTHTILEVVRAGAREFVPRPATQENLTQALQRHIQERDRQNKNDTAVHGKMYSVCSAKCGSGATTVGINLAASLAETPKSKVSFIDLDQPLGDAASYLNIAPRYTISDALAAASRMDSTLLETYMFSHERISILAGLEEFEPGKGMPAEALGQLLDVVMQTYTHSVVDLPVSVDREQVQIVTGMSAVIIVVLTPDLPSLRRTERLLRFMSAFDVSDKIRLVVNRSRKNDEITDRDVEKALKHPVSWKVINDYGACIEAIHSGKALLSTSSKHLARNFRDFSQLLTGNHAPEKRKGLLSLLPKTTTF